MENLRVNFICENCNYLYDLKTRTPYFLPCGHTICETCLNNLWKKYFSVKCPFDNNKHYEDRSSYCVNYSIYDYLKSVDRNNSDYHKSM